VNSFSEGMLVLSYFAIGIYYAFSASLNNPDIYTSVDLCFLDLGPATRSKRDDRI